VSKPTLLAVIGLGLCLTACNTIETSLAAPEHANASCTNASDLHTEQAREFACSGNVFSALSVSDKQVGEVDAGQAPFMQSPARRQSYQYLMQTPGVIVAQ